MTRIDHAAEALACEEAGLSIMREQSIGIAPHMEVVMQFDLARLHAQLALVEQQRIANLIAWTTRDGYEPLSEVRNIIAEGLGL
jgi:hypothetical protein